MPHASVDYVPSGATSANDVAVVIVNWNGCDVLRECLNSLHLQSVTGFEVVVVDNASTDDSVAMLARDFPEVKLVQSSENLGFAGGVNLGIAATERGLIITLNNDATADGAFIERLLARASQLPAEVGMYQAKIRFSNDPSRLNSTGIVMAANGHAKDRAYNGLDATDVSSSEVFCPTAGAAMYRREMLEAVRLQTGIFDGSYFMYFEDVDLGWRCRIAGYRAEYVDDAVVYHGFQTSSRKLESTFVPMQCKRNRLRTLVKNGSWRFLIRTLPTTIADTWWLIRHTRLREQLVLFSHVRTALGLRRFVQKLGRRSRREIELRWAGKES